MQVIKKKKGNSFIRLMSMIVWAAPLTWMKQAFRCMINRFAVPQNGASYEH